MDETFCNNSSKNKFSHKRILEDQRTPKPKTQKLEQSPNPKKGLGTDFAKNDFSTLFFDTFRHGFERDIFINIFLPLFSLLFFFDVDRETHKMLQNVQKCFKMLKNASTMLQKCFASKMLQKCSNNA